MNKSDCKFTFKKLKRRVTYVRFKRHFPAFTEITEILCQGIKKRRTVQNRSSPPTYSSIEGSQVLSLNLHNLSQNPANVRSNLSNISPIFQQGREGRVIHREAKEETQKEKRESEWFCQRDKEAKGCCRFLFLPTGLRQVKLVRYKLIWIRPIHQRVLITAKVNILIGKKHFPKCVDVTTIYLSQKLHNRVRLG